ncbi:CBL-interacting serine/threonine-protein kinase 6 [Lathyrus oleraceus]|uniref:non-specific serine/threonine protein kinase n=1 Tax=Pisum sativum TaxID=3888 RepID=A0A9D4X702_PEA|nr:CBL-interacting serine/threonine-protein kinase 6 [Pisum sativum]
MCEKEKESSHSALLDGKYELGRVLGHGTFAKVYHARNLNSGKNVAMKVVGKEKKGFGFLEAEKSSMTPTTMNAFHIISLSEGFDLSPLFEEKKREEREEMRFATAGTASRVISKLEQVAKAVKFDVKSSDTKVRLQGQERGRKGKLAIAADIYAVTPSFLVVEVKKDKGDTLEYNQFCSKQLRPALKDIFWTSTDPPAA